MILYTGLTYPFPVKTNKTLNDPPLHLFDFYKYLYNSVDFKYINTKHEHIYTNNTKINQQNK